MSTDICGTCPEPWTRQTDGSANENVLEKMKFHSKTCRIWAEL